LGTLEAAITEILAMPEIQKRWADELGLTCRRRAGFDQFVTEDRKHQRWPHEISFVLRMNEPIAASTSATPRTMKTSAPFTTRSSQ
jgi:hypothetical protein